MRSVYDECLAGCLCECVVAAGLGVCGACPTCLVLVGHILCGVFTRC